MALGNFIWGPGGAQLTPEDIALQRSILARRKAAGVDTSPIGSWTQGAARVVDALGDVFQEKRLNDAAAENAAYDESKFSKLASYLGGGLPQANPVAAALTNGTSPPVTTATIPQTADAATIRQGLLDRGLAPHIADAFLVNFKDESGLNPGLNERQPIVPGSRGGYGLYQLTGPRRTAYESFAGQRGVDPSDVNAQLDWLMYELKGPEAKAGETILASGDTASAAQAIVNNFLRPAAQYRDRRSASYANLGMPEQAPQAKSAAPVPVTPSAPSSMPRINPDVLSALDDKRLSERTRGVAKIILDQQMSQQSLAQKQALQEQERQQEIARRTKIAQSNGIDPSFALDDDAWKAATGNIFAAPSTTTLGNSIIDNRTGKPIYQGEAPRQPLMNFGDGTVYDPNAPQDQRFIQAPNSGRGFRQATSDEIKVYGTNGQVGPDGRFYPVTPPQGTALSVDPNTGAVTFNQGPGVKPLTEAQSKDSFFTTRMTAATPTIDKFESVLMSAPEAVADYLPGGRYFQSEEYQLAKDAGRDFVNAYLRKDSGAALTKEEERNYGQLLLPQPGDKPAILAAKRQRRQIAVEAIKSGMPPSAVDGVLKAIQSVPGADQPAKTTNEIQTDIPGVTIRRKN